MLTVLDLLLLFHHSQYQYFSKNSLCFTMLNFPKHVFIAIIHNYQTAIINYSCEKICNMHCVFTTAGFHLWNISSISCRIWLFSSFLFKKAVHFRLNFVVYTFLFYVQVPYYSLNNSKLFTDRIKGFLYTQLKTDLKGLFFLWAVVSGCGHELHKTRTVRAASA